MNESTPSQTVDYPIPETDLFIYYLNGRLVSEKELSDVSYMGTWEEDDTSFLFFSKPRPELIDRLLAKQKHLTLIDHYHMTYDEWQGEKFSAFHVGRFFISPPWEPSRSHPEDIPVLLDPGLVFGNGNHPTTRDCIKALELVFAREAIDSVLDLGTGTGILSLAAAKLGSSRNYAVDINHLAAKTARKNVCLNKLEDRILVSKGMAETFIHLPSDLIIANIHYDVMKSLILQDNFYNKKWFILSGILRSQARDITAVLQRCPVNILERWEHDSTWHTFCGEIY